MSSVVFALANLCERYIPYIVIDDVIDFANTYADPEVYPSNFVDDCLKHINAGTRIAYVLITRTVSGVIHVDPTLYLGQHDGSIVDAYIVHLVDIYGDKFEQHYYVVDNPEYRMDNSKQLVDMLTNFGTLDGI